MSDRLYLYNKTEIGSTDDACEAFMEWGYEFPLMLHPLFSSNPRVAENCYNTEMDELGLYADAPGGIAALRKFYAFIDKHAQSLVDDIPAFQEAQRKIFQLLEERACHPLFHLDASSIFQDVSPDAEGEEEPDYENFDFVAAMQKEARSFFAQIQKNNDCIQKAIAQDNPALLDDCPELDSILWRGNFRIMFNNEGYEYGWAVITSMIFDLEDEDEDEED